MSMEPTGNLRRILPRFCASRFFLEILLMPGKWLMRCHGSILANRSWIVDTSILHI